MDAAARSRLKALTICIVNLDFIRGDDANPTNKDAMTR
jgi:hypothetical protein